MCIALSERIISFRPCWPRKTMGSPMGWAGGWLGFVKKGSPMEKMMCRFPIIITPPHPVNIDDPGPYNLVAITAIPGQPYDANITKSKNISSPSQYQSNITCCNQNYRPWANFEQPPVPPVSHHNTDITVPSMAI